MNRGAFATGPLGLPVARPNVIDRVVSFFAPGAGLKRLRARTLFALSGGYDGARSDRPELQTMSRLARGWESDTLGDLPALRARSRELYRNAPIAKSGIDTKVTSIIGWGLDPQPRVDREYLGLSDEAARRWQRQAKRLWWHWAWSAASDWAGRFTFPVLNALATKSRFLGGDVLVLRQWREPRAGELFGLRLQLVEADRLCNPNGAPDTDRLCGGIEMDRDGRPVAFHVCDRHPEDRLLGGRPAEWTRVPAVGAASGERRVLHLFRPDRPHAFRGVPELAAVIGPLRQLKEYTNSELMAALISSFFTVFVKHAGEEIDGQQALGLKEVLGTQANTAGAPKADGQVQLGPALIADLVPGEDISIANPMRPNDKFDPFITAVSQQIGAAIGVPYELLVKRFTASYSASMAALQEAWRDFRTERAYTADHLCQPTYEWMLTEAVLRGYLDAPGFFEDPLARQAWCGATWTGPARGHLNPAQEATAMTTRLTAGVTTLEQETAEYSGRDWEENLAQAALERRLRTAAGLGVEPVAERIRTEPTEPAPVGGGPDDEPDDPPREDR